jgi:hypothetical protein
MSDEINTIEQILPITFGLVFDQLTLNLKVMGNIKNGDKLSTVNSNFEINSYSYTRSIYRSYTGDSRTKTLEKSLEVVEDVIRITNQLLNLEPFADNINELPDNNAKILQDLIPDMVNANKGLLNLQLTYNGDVLTENKLDMVIKKLADQVVIIKNNMKVDRN